MVKASQRPSGEKDGLSAERSPRVNCRAHEPSVDATHTWLRYSDRVSDMRGVRTTYATRSPPGDRAVPWMARYFMLSAGVQRSPAGCSACWAADGTGRVNRASTTASDPGWRREIDSRGWSRREGSVACFIGQGGSIHPGFAGGPSRWGGALGQPTVYAPVRGGARQGPGRRTAGWPEVTHGPRFTATSQTGCQRPGGSCSKCSTRLAGASLSEPC